MARTYVWVPGPRRPRGLPSRKDRRIRAYLILALTGALLFPAPAHAKQGCRTKACEKRVQAKRDRAEMARYKRSPMPRCTWFGESGVGNPEWSPRRYLMRNPSSTAAGKFQILDTTWHGVGGPNYSGSHDAAKARPVLQERLARRVLRQQGLGAWVLC